MATTKKVELQAAIHGKIWGILIKHGKVGSPQIDEPRNLFDELVDGITEVLEQEIGE